MDDSDLFEMAPDSVEETKEGRHSVSSRGSLRSWQRFVLALLLFLDVAVIGFLVLVMLGRMQF